MCVPRWHGFVCMYIMKGFGCRCSGKGHRLLQMLWLAEAAAAEHLNINGTQTLLRCVLLPHFVSPSVSRHSCAPLIPTLAQYNSEGMPPGSVRHGAMRQTGKATEATILTDLKHPDPSLAGFEERLAMGRPPTTATVVTTAKATASTMALDDLGLMA